jgi:hypothetical protein
MPDATVTVTITYREESPISKHATNICCAPVLAFYSCREVRFVTGLGSN